MNLLIISNNPDRASFRQRIGVYIEPLADRGIACEVASLPPGLWSRRKLFQRAGDFDCVFLHKKKLNIFDARLLRRYSRRIVYNYDDAIMFSDKHPQRYSRSHFVPFRRTVRLADMVLVGSEYLARQAANFHDNVHILPLGLKTASYNVPDSKPDDGRIRLVWIGSGSTLTYLRDVIPAIEGIGRKFDNVVLRIIGDDFFDLDSMPVEKVLWGEQSRYRDLAACDVGLAPLPSDRFSGGKCSFKVLEYSAASLAVVASPVGTNADHVVQGRTGYLVNTLGEWTKRLEELIYDSQLRAEMGRAGREHAAGYDISIVADKLAAMLQTCADGH